MSGSIIERFAEAAREADHARLAERVALAEAERDEARGKLDKVREVGDRLRIDAAYHEGHEADTAEIRTADGWRNVDDYAQDLLVILDE